jgi:hypothetical protein
LSAKERRNLPLKVPSSVAAGVLLSVKEPFAYTKQIQPVLKGLLSSAFCCLLPVKFQKKESKRFLAFEVSNQYLANYIFKAGSLFLKK